MSGKWDGKIRTLLVTGGCGFIGSNFIRLVLEQRPTWKIINLDVLSYAGNPDNLKDLQAGERYRFVRGDICDRAGVAAQIRECEAVVHFAAESHVDRSIADSSPFIRTNVQGTQVILDALREAGGRRLVHVSTDEVYGSLPLEDRSMRFTEQTPLAPNSPYSASKAASDLLVRAAHETFGLDAVITRCSNNFGPYQFPEKVIPLFVTHLIQGRPVPLYGDGLNVRDWLHVTDHCEAVLAVLERGRAGEVYNIGGDNERSNLELTREILRLMKRGEEMIRRVPDRLGHDRRYAIDASKIQTELGWQPVRSRWPEALARTVDWYVKNPDWWKRVQSGAYRAGL